MSFYSFVKKVFCFCLLLLSFNIRAQQVKKVDCCGDINTKATIIINDNASNAATLTSLGTVNTSFNFKLSSSANTSAGVYNTDGSLIRTLWGGVRYDAGCYVGQWDGLLDDGTQAAYGSYQVKVLSNNVQYTWEGVIGNSTKNHFRTYGGFGPFAFSTNNGYFGDSFAEGGVQTHWFDLKDIQTINNVDIGLSATITGVTCDNSNVYWCVNNDYESPGGNFIFATKISDNSNVNFRSAIQHASGRGGTVQNNVIGYFADGSDKRYSAITVQKNGNLLFATRLDTLYVFNKISGSILTKTTIPGIKRIASGITNDLWAIIGPNVNKIIVDNNGVVSFTNIYLQNLIEPLSLAISPDGNTVSICDNNTSQVKSYSTSTGKLIWSLGQPGGYKENPVAANDKFAFLAANFGFSYIAYQADGSFWVNSDGEYCVKHFNADLSYKERISYIPSSRSSNADPNNPTRVFADELEFERDYSKPLDNGLNGSWKLKNVWTPGTNLDIYRKFDRVGNFVKRTHLCSWV